MTLTIKVSDLAAARKLLTKIRFSRLTLPVLNNVLATVDAAGLSLAVTDLDHWLETRLPAVIEPFAPGRFLVPGEAFKAAVRGDKKGCAHFAFSETKEGPTLTLTVPCAGMNARSDYKLAAVAEFPERPTVDGQITTMPKETFAALSIVADCASTDATRYVLNGVLFTPDDGGLLVACDGRRLAAAPSRFAGKQFILPTPAVQVLRHPDFAARDATARQPVSGTNRQLEFRSGPHTLIAKEIEGSYPNYRLVVPTEFLAEATIPETHRPAVISWLKSLTGDRLSVRFSWERANHLTLACVQSDDQLATMQVPVVVAGLPPVIAFEPHYLASAMAIGPSLRFIDSLSPLLVHAPSGAYCVLMPKRCVPEVVVAHAASPATHQAGPVTTAAVAA